MLTWPPRVPTKTDYPVKNKYVVPAPYPTPVPTMTSAPTSTPSPAITISPNPNPAFTVTPQYVVPPLPSSGATPVPSASVASSPDPTSSTTTSPTPSPSPNPTYSIIEGNAKPPIPYPKPTVTPEVVLPTQGPDPVFTPVILSPTPETRDNQASGEIPNSSSITLVLSNGPSTVSVTQPVSKLAELAIDAGEVIDPVRELAATGEVRKSTSASRRYERAQERAAKSWPRGPAVAKMSWDAAGTGEQRTFYVMEDVTKDALVDGPGWYPTTAQPGRAGNTAIAGHRLGYGDPFEHLDELRPGDEIELQGRGSPERSYQVVDSFVVDPEDTWVLGPNILRDGSDTLTLTTCDPPGVNTQRLIVVARARNAGAGNLR